MFNSSKSSSSSEDSNIRCFTFNLNYLALRAAGVAKLVILGISPLTSFILALRVVLAAKSVISGILFSIFFILALYTSTLTTSRLLHHLVYLNHQEQVLICQHLIYLLHFSNCLNYMNIFVSISIYSIYQYLNYTHQLFLAKPDVSTTVSVC